MADPLQPEPSVLAKLASFVVHVDEFNSPNGHDYDMEAVKALLQDDELNHWIIAMRHIGMAPMKR